MQPINRTALAATIVLSIAACKKDTAEPTPTTNTPTEVEHDATIRMSFTFMLGDNTYTLDSILHDSLGHAVKLDELRFFVSGTHALNDEDEEVGHFEDAYLLVDASQDNDYLLGPIHASHIHAFHFDLGLDSTANHGDISTAEAPLNDASMHWNATDGYKFLVISGHADLDANPDLETAITFTVGLDEMLTEGHAHVHHDIVQDETFTGEAFVAMDILFAGIDLATAPNGTQNAPVCSRLMENLSQAIDGAE